MNIAIIGAGLIGNKRALALDSKDKLVIICDKDISKAKILANKFSAKSTDDINDIILSNIDIVIISVVNRYAFEIAEKVLFSGKHILCEKPLGINSKESKKLIAVSKKYNKKIKTGFNHRFHPGMMKAKAIVDSDRMGKVIALCGLL